MNNSMNNQMNNQMNQISRLNHISRSNASGKPIDLLTRGPSTSQSPTLRTSIVSSRSSSMGKSPMPYRGASMSPLTREKVPNFSLGMGGVIELMPNVVGSQRDLVRENEALRAQTADLEKDNQLLKSQFAALRLAKGALARSLEVMIKDYTSLAQGNDAQFTKMKKAEAELDKLKHDMLKLVAETSIQIKSLSIENQKLRAFAHPGQNGLPTAVIPAIARSAKRKLIEEVTTHPNPHPPAKMPMLNSPVSRPM